MMRGRIGDKIDDISIRHARFVLSRRSSLKANTRIHAAGISSLGTIGAAFLKFAADSTVGTAFAVICFVILVFLILTAFLCLQNHDVF
jgi:hypothetical protein